MRVALVVLAVCVVAVVAGPQPKFSNDWTAIEEDTLIVVQGPVAQVGSLYCCAATSDCQVQIQYQAGDAYVDYTNNRTRFDDKVSGQVIINNFAIQKQMLVVNQTCKEYCPMQGDSMSPGFLAASAIDKGPTTLPDGRKAQHWQWQEKILGIIVMETIDVYVNQTDMNNGIPLEEVDHLTPFGEHIGDMYSNWKNYKPGTPDPSLFIVNGIDSCPESPNCGNSEHQMQRLRTHSMRSWVHHQQESNIARGVARANAIAGVHRKELPLP